ncbi:hypothetical protein [Methylopila sp. Yamaguchi]|uniref:hypothetical protein n=1 Tax=Methylopila sp. Yamaguchi TaxID=1437817 RepID=UPI000CB69F23|nr:hypothetical protein [Methylopila sp. Yamaguchi]GBD48133.1 hypothetical protein METY_1346 [Methylopila sp. Yamaguchi]
MSKSVSKSEMSDLVWSMPMLRVAEQFDVSSSYLKRLCTQHGIPTPPQGYWNKVAHGKRVTKRPRLQRHSKDEIIVIQGGSHQSSRAADPDGLSLEAALLRVPKLASLRESRLPHPFVREAIQSDEAFAKERRRDPASRQVEGANTSSPDSNRRRYMILNALIKGLEAMGFRVDRERLGYSANYPSGGRSSIDFSLYERSRQTWISDPPPQTALDKMLWRERRLQLVPTGHLLLQLIAHPRGQAPLKWEEPKRLLDERLPEILASFEVHRHADIMQAQRDAERAARVAERQQALKAEQDRREEEDEAWRRFEERANAWVKVSKLRQFLAAIDMMKLDDTEIVDERTVADWRAWARRRVEATDPLKTGSQGFRGLLSSIAAVD